MLAHPSRESVGNFAEFSGNATPVRWIDRASRRLRAQQCVAVGVLALQPLARTLLFQRGRPGVPLGRSLILVRRPAQALAVAETLHAARV